MTVKETLKFWESVNEDRSEQSNICQKCNTRVYRSEIRLRGRHLHKECFQCLGCRKLLNLATFTEVNNELFCSECYAECFSRRWRCSELIDTKRLSTQLQGVVMQGQHYRWLPSEASNRDSENSESTASFYSALSESSQLPSTFSRQLNDSVESACTVDESDEDPPKFDSFRRRSQTQTSFDRPVSNRPENPRNPNPHRLMRQSSRGRMIASEGVPEPSFKPSPHVYDRSKRGVDEEAEVTQVRLRATPARARAPGSPDCEEASREHRSSKIYSIRESSEDSEGTDSGESQPETSSSEGKSRITSIMRRIRITQPAVGTESDVSATGREAAASTVKPSQPSVARKGRYIRQSRFPSDHLFDIPVVPLPDPDR
ncbi:uncharacterized protein LOC100908444 [Galendromus occidentalis]|uniref:Uncharacterized protein LOC100908444 n=1 Tax=Galendromus occidentalis TaxID=34638 RepID=A0AAJ6QQI1_9ACAR|nr:uncharacterized protein LOC100908444 [Galendromus occidentalis]